MIAPGLSRNLENPLIGQPKVIPPSAHMGPSWPALPPGGECGIGGKAQRCEQFCKKPIKFGLARLRVLLLLYRFT